MNAARLLYDNVARYGEYRKLIFEGASFTNTDRLQYAGALAGALRQYGVEPGGCVAVMMLNSPEVEAAIQACWMLGAAILPITPQLAAREAAFMIRDSGASVILTSPPLSAKVREAAANAPTLRHTLAFGPPQSEGVADITPAVSAATPVDAPVPRQPSDLAVLLYTSGTTGTPKGVMLTHENVLAAVDAATANYDVAQRDILLHPLPLSHVYGLIVTNLCNALGWTTVLMSHFDPGRALELIERHSATRMTVVPTMLVYLIQHPGRHKFNTSSLRWVLSGGAPLPEPVRREFESLFHCEVRQGYGLSECAAAAVGYRQNEPMRPGSAGRALHGVELAVRDLTGQPLPAFQQGEVVLRGKNVMAGYWNNPDATHAAIVDGWLFTGDIGYLDNDGYLFITDRKKDLIIKGGENISPCEVEEAVASHPAVAEVSVVGMPDPVFGENVCAAIVLRDGALATPEQIREHAAQMISSFKLPAHILFLETLPKSPVGKVLKREVRKHIAAPAHHTLTA
jgi:long-chain acyl-CoA synthetase